MSDYDLKIKKKKIFERYKAMAGVTVYELLNSGYTLKLYPRKVDTDLTHKILRIELSKKHNIVVTEFSIADELGMVLFKTKQSLDILNGDMSASNIDKLDRHFSVYNKE
jgi:hypothetical protein